MKFRESARPLFSTLSTKYNGIFMVSIFICLFHSDLKCTSMWLQYVNMVFFFIVCWSYQVWKLTESSGKGKRYLLKKFASLNKKCQKARISSSLFLEELSKSDFLKFFSPISRHIISQIHPSLPTVGAALDVLPWTSLDASKTRWKCQSMSPISPRCFYLMEVANK